MFDRSHYEEVLVVRVHNLVPPEVWGTRYDEINAFEKELVDGGMTIIKVAMFVSLKEQKKRLAQRLERPDKYWKYNPADIDERLLWPEIPGGLPSGAGSHVDGLRAVAYRAVRPKVVQPAGDHRVAHRGP